MLMTSISPNTQPTGTNPLKVSRPSMPLPPKGISSATTPVPPPRKLFTTPPSYPPPPLPPNAKTRPNTPLSPTSPPARAPPNPPSVKKKPLHLKTPSHVTCMSVVGLDNDMLWIGCNDGTIQIYSPQNLGQGPQNSAQNPYQKRFVQLFQNSQVSLSQFAAHTSKVNN